MGKLSGMILQVNASPGSFPQVAISLVVAFELGFSAMTSAFCENPKLVTLHRGW